MPHGNARHFDAKGIRQVHRRALEQGVKVVKTQPTAERNPQGLLPKVPPALEAQVEGAFFSRRQDRELPGAISRGLLDCPRRV